jgi:hypothetical protein
MQDIYAQVEDPDGFAAAAGHLHVRRQMFGVRLRISPTVEYHSRMQIASGTVVGGKIVVEGLSLPDGTPVTVLARGDEVAVRLPHEQEAELLDALDEADREEGISAEELFSRLRRFG